MVTKMRDETPPSRPKMPVGSTESTMSAAVGTRPRAISDIAMRT